MIYQGEGENLIRSGNTVSEFLRGYFFNFFYLFYFIFFLHVFYFVIFDLQFLVYCWIFSKSLRLLLIFIEVTTEH